MNTEIRKRAAGEGKSVLDFLLNRLNTLKENGHKPVTILAVCPNSGDVIKAALRAAKRHNAPIKFAATLNQVDSDGGYTGLTHEQFVKIIRQQSQRINLSSPVIIAVDHGGPWLKDLHAREKWSYDLTMAAVKSSFEKAVAAGFDMLHVDPTVDINLPKREVIQIETVVQRTVELITHVENFRRKNNLPPISYEVGTEEVHGGLADLSTFVKFLEGLKSGLKAEGLENVWPCFVVGKVGTDLHTTLFDPKMALELTAITKSYGSLIKGHYTDNASNPESYPESGMGGANVGPEFTEREYEGLMELEALEHKLFEQGLVPKLSSIREALWQAVERSQRWKKWLQPEENPDLFSSISPDRQEWLIKTGCRYIWENPEVIKARTNLYNNLRTNGIDAEEIVLFHIESAMDKYFTKFNLTGLNSELV